MRRTMVLMLALTALASAQDAEPEGSTQLPHSWKLQPYLEGQLRTVAADTKIPLYFVMRDRLGYHHWFPRLNGVPLATRRATVIAELQAHAARTQAETLDVLRAAVARGDASDLRVNWLGNFVEVAARPAVIHDVLALDSVWEAWPNCLGPGYVCPDAPPTVGGFGPPGNGPAEVGADRVWAMGYTGQGVVVMNADQGINRSHRALENQLWRNVPEGWFPNGIDEDNNGYVDDIYGFNFGNNTGDIEDFGSHGTQTAGVMIADDSCTGLTHGIAPGGRLMTGALGSLESDQWEAIQYALLMGADVQTSSYSYKNNFNPPPNYAMHRDIADNTLAAGLIRTNSTSNNGALCNDPFQVVQRPFNVSVPGNVPAPYIDPNQTLVGRKSGVIGVGAYELRTGMLSLFSPCGPSSWYDQDLLYVLPAYPLANWDPNDNDYPWNGFVPGIPPQLGLLKPDVIAPTGTDTSAGPFGTCLISAFGGTSNATPVVMGCIMLWKSANPSLTPEDVGMIIHQTSRDVGSVPGKENTYGAGKVDAFAGLHRALCVHRVNDEPAWSVQQRGHADLKLAVDGSPNRVAVIALGLSRSDVNFGFLTSGIGASPIPVVIGSTGASGDDLTGTIRIPRVTTPFTLYSQAFIDDTAGPTSRWLSSNVVSIDFVN